MGSGGETAKRDSARHLRRQGDPVRRRELVLLLGGAMMTARALRAQQKAMPVVGVLGGGLPGPLAPFVAAFHQGLSENRLRSGAKPGDRIPLGGEPL